MQLTQEALKLRQLCESGVITQKKCWERVAQALKRRGHDVSGRQCMSKFQCLRRTYKSINEYNARLERGEGLAPRRMEWLYYDIVGKLLEDSWTCTLNANCDNQEEKALDLPDVEMISDSRESNIPNEPVEDGINSTQTNSHHNQNDIVLGLAMECDGDGADNDLMSSVAIADSKIENENGTATNEKPKWCDKSTRLLIAEFKEKRNLYVGLGKTIFTAISESLKKKGFAFSPVHVEDYWRALVNAFRVFGTGKSSSTIRVAPYYAELRSILGNKRSTFDFPPKKAVLQHRFAVPSRGVAGAKPSLLKINSGVQLSSENRLSPAQTKDKAPPFVGITNGASNAGESSRHLEKTDTSSSLKEDALSMLRELKEEISKQNREIQKQSQQRDAYCKKLIAQNEIMIKQRERRNELLEELVRLRQNEA